MNRKGGPGPFGAQEEAAMRAAFSARLRRLKRSGREHAVHAPYGNSATGPSMHATPSPVGAHSSAEAGPSSKAYKW